MNSVKYAALAFAATTGLALPTLSHASSMWHTANGEAGYAYYPDHFKSTKTRDQVSAETMTARKDGTLDQLQAQYQLNAPVPVKNAAAGKTRTQVIAELNSETAAERATRMNLLAGS
ncbi:MAG: DUF4148 domain-containing protein [Burkholderiales bacterium]|jgi:hypothetical protein|nr:DUF4148 domain-containing protein [Burkholderiales bacterium]